jgi:hypothetical protein
MKLNKQSGATLLVALSVMATLAVCLAAALQYSSVIEKQSQRMNALTKATEIGNGAVELAYTSWRELCRETPNVPPTTAQLASIAVPTQSMFPNVVGTFPATRIGQSGSATISNFGVIAVDPQLNPLSTGSSAPTPSYGPSLNPASGVSFTNDTSWWYLASADVTIPSMSGNVTAKVRRVFQKQIQSPWQWAIFYVDPLEIHPGAPFTVTGWVHTNQDLYTAHGTNTTFMSKVTYSHDWAVDFMPGDSRYGVETPTMPTFPAGLPAAMDIMHQPFGFDALRVFSTNDTNPNNDSYREVIERPISGTPDPVTGNRYYNMADVIISIDASNAVTIYNMATSHTCTSSSTGADKALYTIVTNNLTTNGSIQDYREQATVRIATLDVGNFTSQVSGTSVLSGFKGIVYISDTSGSATTKRGIKLKNGANIALTTGITIVSENPIYVQGDYNTGKTSSVNTPSNTGTPGTPQVSGYSRKPCAICADAINVLSNNWVDSHSTSGLSSRVATNTTINAAFLSGNVPTSGGVYSGGVENFPRFHEDWSNGVTFTYYGSMVQLFQSKQATGTWPNASYNPPTRQWYFDTNFMQNPPPGPNITNYVKAQWYTQ